ncbi:hypothetical protein [Bacillus pretiosus]|uniref:Uncharacterized protein n=1 Tax=Bacillus pretiosus TaxID=2983392 RepID=A0ABT3EQZ5_9BACI|nr:hypothetical protein [Bacillus pretiosus]MCW1239238.1 hypothetical protein [Bacillus pretiosus]
MSWVKNLAPIIGTVIGAGITYFVQKKSFKNQIELERNKVEWNEKQKNKYLKFEAYNKFLDSDGINEIIVFNRADSINIYSFKAQNYLKYIRPILYGNFHLLNQKVANFADEIEDCLKRCEWNEGIDK